MVAEGADDAASAVVDHDSPTRPAGATVTANRHHATRTACIATATTDGLRPQGDGIPGGGDRAVVEDTGPATIARRAAGTTQANHAPGTARRTTAPTDAFGIQPGRAKTMGHDIAIVGDRDRATITAAARITTDTDDTTAVAAVPAIAPKAGCMCSACIPPLSCDKSVIGHRDRPSITAAGTGSGRRIDTTRAAAVTTVTAEAATKQTGRIVAVRVHRSPVQDSDRGSGPPGPAVTTTGIRPSPIATLATITRDTLPANAECHVTPGTDATRIAYRNGSTIPAVSAVTRIGIETEINRATVATITADTGTLDSMRIISDCGDTSGAADRDIASVSTIAPIAAGTFKETAEHLTKVMPGTIPAVAAITTSAEAQNANGITCIDGVPGIPEIHAEGLPPWRIRATVAP